jgi:HrpA-like RNA helicase
MDEVHERDIDIDFSLIIIKHFLKVFPGVKLILMSATICAEKFSNYFAKNSI